jgi:glycerophosphoryl diester phosphodiesterase
VEIIGHRGFSARAPENTLAALRMALDAGADAVEWDVRVAACGTPVLIHDASLERTTDGHGAVAEQTAESLGRLDAGAWFGPSFAGERIPTLREALAEVAPYGASVYSEVKACHREVDLERMARTVHEIGLETRTVFISLDFDIVDRLAALGDACRMGYVVAQHGQFQDALARARRLPGRGLVDLGHQLVLEDPDLVPRARAQGVDVAVWTVDEVPEAQALARAGVRRFTTNQVEALVSWRDGLPPRE